MKSSRKPCVNCTCATTGFCPRGVGANIPPELAAARPAQAGKPLSPGQLRRAELGAAANPLDAAAVRLMEGLCRHLAERPGKGFGHFERDEGNFPMAHWVRAHAIEGRLDFAGLSREMLGH